MEHIRKAQRDDLSRIAEIFVFNNRINYLPIFRDEKFSFGTLQVVSVIDRYFGCDDILKGIYVFDDGIIRGFIEINKTEICKLYVDPFFQGKGIGGELIEFAKREHSADHLWALEKNHKAIAFYERHGFFPSSERKTEEGTDEFIIRMDHKKRLDTASL